ncbi:MAG: hypothetical protein EBT70_13965 [Betaproteobacteria bacterium]|nr:hypothetical protein [Betaproteobacteria bacterium]
MTSIRCFAWLITLGLLAQHAPAWADWEPVDENHLAVIYIDPNKIRASSVYPQAWHLFDLFDKTKAGVKSRLVLMEYDCHDARRRTLAFASKSDAMGEGKTLFTSTEATNWRPVSGDTVGEKVIEMLCGHNSHKKAHTKSAKSANGGKEAAAGDAHAAPAPSGH